MRLLFLFIFIALPSTCVVASFVNFFMATMAIREVERAGQPVWKEEQERLWIEKYDMDAMEFLDMVDIWYPCPTGETLFCHDMSK